MNYSYNQSENEVVVAVDIGTTKICAMAGRRNEYGRFEVLGLGKVDSTGVLRGVVANIDKTVKAISEAVEKCKRNAGIEEIDEVFVGIAGQHINSYQHRGILVRDNHIDEISQEDIDKLQSDMHKLVFSPGERILHVIPQEYTVDHEQGITDPIGMSGVRLEANFHIITGQITSFHNIEKCFKKIGLDVADITLEPIASAKAVLSEEEMEAGIAIVDIGGGTTDLTIIKDNIIRHTAVIPFGGSVITRDIMEGCSVMQDKAEKLKVKFGSALADEITDNRVITIPGFKGQEAKEISEKNMAYIVQARTEEILDYVQQEVRKSGFERNLIGGIVMTGGGSLLRHITSLTELHTGISTRIGEPVEKLAHGYPKQVASPIFSTVIGLLIHGIQTVENREQTEDADRKTETEEQEEQTASRKPGKFQRFMDGVMDRVKEYMEPTPDSDL